MPSPPPPGPPPPPPNVFGDDYQAQLYLGMVVDNAFRFEPGVCVLPVAEDPPTDPTELAAWSPVVVLRLHAPYRVRRTAYRSEKQVNPPVLPTPADAGAFVFVGGDVSLAASQNLSLATYDWSGVADYLMVENCVSRPEDGLVLGVQPWEAQSSFLNGLGAGGATPAAGAIARAGADALVGYQMSQGISDTAPWWYNCTSYYPGTLFDGTVLNGGPDE